LLHAIFSGIADSQQISKASRRADTVGSDKDRYIRFWHTANYKVHHRLPRFIFALGATASSRSMMTASVPLAIALESLSDRLPGTKTGS
jgi:hypothetical protein